MNFHIFYDNFPVEHMKDDLHIPMLQPQGCGCRLGRNGIITVCEEGKRLDRAVSAAYRNTKGLYDKVAQKQANKKWREACTALEQHIRANERD